MFNLPATNSTARFTVGAFLFTTGQSQSRMYQTRLSLLPLPAHVIITPHYSCYYCYICQCHWYRCRACRKPPMALAFFTLGIFVTTAAFCPYPVFCRATDNWANYPYIRDKYSDYPNTNLLWNPEKTENRYRRTYLLFLSLFMILFVKLRRYYLI